MSDVNQAKAVAADSRTVSILAKNIYREARSGGLSERDVMALAGELLSLVANEVRGEDRVSASQDL